MNTKFTINYDQEINKFLASNKHAYPLLAYKETEINLPKVAELSSLNQPRILRICRSRCRQYLPDRLVAEVREQNSDIPQEVYWIDSSTHNIGVV